MYLLMKKYTLCAETHPLKGVLGETQNIHVHQVSSTIYDFRDVLINAKQNSYTNFVVDCPSTNIDLILDHAQQVGLMADEHSYIFVSPDLFSKDLVGYRYGGVNMTGDLIYWRCFDH